MQHSFVRLRTCALKKIVKQYSALVQTRASMQHSFVRLRTCALKIVKQYLALGQTNLSVREDTNR